MSQISFIDVHAHLQDKRFVGEVEQCIENAVNAGVTRIINAGSSMADSRKVLELAEAHEACYGVVGIHPHDAKGFKDGDVETLKEMLRHPKILGIGEIGLDFHYDFSEREVQVEVFKRLWALAAELGVPAVIHVREAYEAFFAAIKGLPQPPKVLLHCYSGSLETAKIAYNLGFSFSIGGVLTFNNSKKAVEVFSWLSPDRIHLETDCPYLAPQGKRGKRNEPAYVTMVAEFLAKQRGVSLEHLAAQLTTNAKNFFGEKLV
jgi:TatD DNase family protein